MKKRFLIFVFFVFVLSFLGGVNAFYIDITGDAVYVNSLSDCLNISYCVNYQTKADCEENLCSVFDEAVERSIGCGEGHICGCWWNESVNRCGPYWEVLWEDSKCFPKCSGKECGDDGCGGICGVCWEGVCNSEGICVPNEPSGCLDSDGGLNYYVKGNITVVDYFNEDRCLDSYVCEKYFNSLYCLEEFYCGGGTLYGGDYGSAYYNCPYGCEEGICLENLQDTCSLFSRCSDGYVCENGFCVYEEFVNECSWLNPCEGGYVCQEGVCVEDSVSLLDIPAGENQKNLLGYSDKEVFLISDNDWRRVLQLVPLTTWTGRDDSRRTSESCNTGYLTPRGVCVYPSLIYHQEEERFDVDSIFYFMRQYNVDKVTLIGDTPYGLDNLLVNEFGLNVADKSIKRVSPRDYFYYWSAYKDVVYVEEDYELALVASTYASLINAPLVIRGGELDIDEAFEGRNVICVADNLEDYVPVDRRDSDSRRTSGDLNSSVKLRIDQIRNCNEKYSLNQLQQKYALGTSTDKLVLVNPDDINMEVTTVPIVIVEADGTSYPGESKANVFCKESNQEMNKLYSKTSMAAPFLASAKHELILTSSRALSYGSSLDGRERPSNLVGGDSILASYVHEYPKDLSLNPRYLTIVAAPNAIEHRMYTYTTIDDPISIGSQKEDIYIALDQNLYADYGSYFYVGRIMGLTISDVSSYISRSLFYNSLLPEDNALFMGSSYEMGDVWDGMESVKRMSDSFQDAGYTIDEKYIYDSFSFDPALWSKYDYNLIFYADHGDKGWAGINYWQIPNLKNSLVVADACLTASVYTDYSFWAWVIRNGAIGYAGSVGVSMTMTGPVYSDFINGVYHGDAYTSSMSLGQAMGTAYKNKVFGDIQERWRYMVTLIGDPTLNINPPYRVGYIT